MNKILLSLLIGFGTLYLNKTKKHFILYSILLSIVVYLIIDKSNIEGMDNKSSSKSGSKSTPMIPATVSKPNPKPSTPMIPATVSKPDPKPSTPMIPATVSKPTKTPTGPGINSSLIPAKVSKPTMLSNKKCDLKTCQSLLDQKCDQLIPSLDDMVKSCNLTPNEREKVWMNTIKSRADKILEEEDKKGQDRMTCNGLEKCGQFSIYNINVTSSMAPKMKEFISEVKQKMKDAKSPQKVIHPDSTDLNKPIKLSPMARASSKYNKKTTNSISQNTINKGILNYNVIPEPESHYSAQKRRPQMPKSPYSYADDWLSVSGRKAPKTRGNNPDFKVSNEGDSNGYSGTITAYNDDEWNNHDLRNSGFDSNHSTSLPVPDMQGDALAKAML